MYFAYANRALVTTRVGSFVPIITWDTDKRCEKTNPCRREAQVNIYVGNLAYAITESDLRSMFEEHGEVASTNVISDRATGQSKGFGFVEMPQKEQAEAAIAKLNGTDMQGRAITVNEARPRQERPPRRSW
jgi:RNA recognition motif-containing protein